MTTFLSIIALILIICLIVGLVRAFVGPDNSNRMLAAQLSGTIGVALVLVLGFAIDNDNLIDLALIITLLSSITIVAFLKLAEAPQLATMSQPNQTERKASSDD